MFSFLGFSFWQRLWFNILLGLENVICLVTELFNYIKVLASIYLVPRNWPSLYSFLCGRHSSAVTYKLLRWAVAYKTCICARDTLAARYCRKQYLVIALVHEILDVFYVAGAAISLTNDWCSFPVIIWPWYLKHYVWNDSENWFWFNLYITCYQSEN